MKGEIYIVPMGMLGDNLITTVEILVRDYLISINPESGLSLVDEEEIKEKFNNLKCMAEIEIDQETEENIKGVKSILEEKLEKELNILEKIGPTLQKEIDRIQNEPQIHIPTMDEISELGQNRGSSIIIDD